MPIDPHDSGVTDSAADAVEPKNGEESGEFWEFVLAAATETILLHKPVKKTPPRRRGRRRSFY